jgi:lipopolysaccharide/colanic/teichoic acid biosynthesis glycosyltransferase
VEPLVAEGGRRMALQRSGLLAAATSEQGDTGLPRIVRSRAKRATDVAIAATGLVLLLPAMGVIALAILVSSGRPVLFAQERVGKDSQRFRCWKYRTMVKGAESLREDLIPLNEAPFPAFKLSRDPRITPIGRFLRKSSIDELPQLWNVLRGDMSLVGPRPPLPSEVAHYGPSQLQRLVVRPGLTCTWQIQSRHRTPTTFEQWVQWDLDYIGQWSLLLDVRLMARTVAEVIRMSGR